MRYQFNNDTLRGYKYTRPFHLRLKFSFSVVTAVARQTGLTSGPNPQPPPPAPFLKRVKIRRYKRSNVRYFQVENVIRQRHTPNGVARRHH